MQTLERQLLAVCTKRRPAMATIDYFVRIEVLCLLIIYRSIGIYALQIRILSLLEKELTLRIYRTEG